MPYPTNGDLPLSVQKVLPTHAQDIYRESFNHAFVEYTDPHKRQDPQESLEEISHKVAWAAVKNKYMKNNDGVWIKKDAS